jgi:hypothetical protein
MSVSLEGWKIGKYLAFHPSNTLAGTGLPFCLQYPRITEKTHQLKLWGEAVWTNQQG